MTRRILFVHNHPTKFVQLDCALLSERYRVREWYQATPVVNLARLARAVMESDVVFGWFASWHTFFPLLFARALERPTVLVVGGYDTANLAEIGYGSQRGGVRRVIARATMNLADALITNSQYARDEAARNAGVDPRRVTVVYHGLDANAFTASDAKDNLVVTIANVERDNLQRKGLEPFVRAAALLPEAPFVVIGAWRDDAITRLRALASPNVQFTGRVTEQELRAYLARARVYVQASRHEAFGMAVAEAMLAECIPVVTRAGALPEVVGDAGIYVDAAEPDAIAEGASRALECDAAAGTRARQRILDEFPLERRRAGLFALIDRTLAGFER